jgi:hypothetical protein
MEKSILKKVFVLATFVLAIGLTMSKSVITSNFGELKLKNLHLATISLANAEEGDPQNECPSDHSLCSSSNGSCVVCCSGGCYATKNDCGCN